MYTYLHIQAWNKIVSTSPSEEIHIHTRDTIRRALEVPVGYKDKQQDRHVIRRSD